MDISLGRVLPTYPTSADRAGAAGDAAGAGRLGASGGASSTKSVADSFGAVLSQALEDVNAAHQVADAGAARLASGQPVDLHQVLIQMEQANLTFGLGLQVRNKLIEAYQEISRMTI